MTLGLKHFSNHILTCSSSDSNHYINHSFKMWTLVCKLQDINWLRTRLTSLLPLLEVQVPHPSWILLERGTRSFWALFFMHFTHYHLSYCKMGYKPEILVQWENMWHDKNSFPLVFTTGNSGSLEKILKLPLSCTLYFLNIVKLVYLWSIPTVTVARMISTLTCMQQW